MEKEIIEKYQTIIQNHMDNILTLYYKFPDKPLMLYDIQEMLIYAYPYEEFIKGLNENSKAKTISQYNEAKDNNQIVIFIRDNENKKLMSYTFDI